MSQTSFKGSPKAFVIGSRHFLSVLKFPDNLLTVMSPFCFFAITVSPCMVMFDADFDCVISSMASSRISNVPLCNDSAMLFFLNFANGESV